MRFRVEVIDVWAMTVTPVEGEFVLARKDRYHFVDTKGRTVSLPGKRGIAIWILPIDGTPGKTSTSTSTEDI